MADRAKLMEDIITRRLLNGDTMQFLTEIKQANVTPAEAKSSNLFGDPKIGELLGTVLDNLNDDAAVQPALTELRDYIKSATNVTDPTRGTGEKGKDAKENFSMDNKDKDRLADAYVSDAQANVKSAKDIADMSDVDSRMGKLEANFAMFAEEVKEMVSALTEKAPEKKVGELTDAADKVIDVLDPKEDPKTNEEAKKEIELNCSANSVTINMSMDTYLKARTAARLLKKHVYNFAETDPAEGTLDEDKVEKKIVEDADGNITFSVTPEQYESIMGAISRIKNFSEKMADKEDEVCPECGKPAAECECGSDEDMCSDFDEDEDDGEIVTVKLTKAQYDSARDSIDRLQKFANLYEEACKKAKEKGTDFAELPLLDEEEVEGEEENFEGEDQVQDPATAQPAAPAVPVTPVPQVAVTPVQPVAPAAPVAPQATTAVPANPQVAEAPAKPEVLTEEEKKAVNGTNFSENTGRDLWGYLYGNK